MIRDIRKLYTNLISYVRYVRKRYMSD